jgi:hypothetical protein
MRKVAVLIKVRLLPSVVRALIAALLVLFFVSSPSLQGEFHAAISCIVLENSVKKRV